MTDRPTYSPSSVVATVMDLLKGQGIVIDRDDLDGNVYLAASALLLTLGVDPEVDGSPEGLLVSGLVLESRVRTSTRSRRAL